MTTYSDHPDGRRLAYDPYEHPEYYDHVRRRRVMAFVVDFLIIGALGVAAGIAVLFLGFLTFGLGWLLFGGIFPVIVCLYTAVTLGGPNSATPGMQAMNLQMRTWYGEPIYPLLALVHVLIFYLSVTILSPFVLLVCLFSDRKRLLHDIVLGTVVINTETAIARDSGQPIAT